MSFYREFYGGEGTAVQGSWSWGTSASQTDYASLKGGGAGFWRTNPDANNDEYKWSDIYLTRGKYKATIVWYGSSTRGIINLLYGNTLLGTKDMYSASPVYNQVWTTYFTLNADTTADIRFKVNGKNESSTNYYADFSRFKIEKVGD